MKLLSVCVKSLAVGCLFLLGAQQAFAHRSPANCGGAGVGVQVFKFRLNGSIANTITNGERVIYTIQVQNDAQLPTPGGNVPVCDVTCASVLFRCPDASGNPGPVIVVATNVNLPFGTPPFTAGSVTCTVNVASGVASARARAEVQGVVHDLTIPGCTPDATCVTNACDPDIGGGQQEVSVTIRNPCINVIKQCVSTANPSGTAVIVTFSVTVTNCGDETLVNIGVTNNQPVAGTVLTNISQLAVGQSVTFTRSYTNTSGNICGPFNDTVTATGTGLGSGATGTASGSASCPITYNPSISVTKLCPATNGLPGGVLGFSGQVCNTGNVPLTNVTVVDNVTLATGGNLVASFPLLTNGECRTFSGTINIPANACSISDTLTARGTNICGGAGVVATATTNCPVACAPAIKVYKQVVCFSNQCEPFSPNLDSQKTAIGVSLNPPNNANCPAFCYRITVTNVGNVTLSNLVVSDFNIGDGKVLNLSGCGFPATLAPGGQPGSSASCIVTTNHCVSATNIVTASGVGQTAGGGTQTVTSTDTNRVTVNPISVDCRLLVSVNNGATFTEFHAPNCATQNVGQSYIIRVVVTNTGSFPLQNVLVTDTAGTLGACVTANGNIGNLGVGATATFNCTNTCSSTGVVNYAISVSAVASQAQGHVCDFNLAGAQLVARSSCDTCVNCVLQARPRICVTKEVVCELPNGCANNWSELATGAKTADNSQCPSFCYRIRVTNCGNEDLRNVTVADNRLNLSGCNFPTTLAVNQTVECILVGVTHCNNVTNTVTATGVGVLSGVQTNATDTAAVVVLPISIRCEATVNGQPQTAIPCDGQGHLITNAVQVCNTGSLPLSDITINAPDLLALGCTNLANLRLSLLPGQCTNLPLCIDLVTCPPSCDIAFSNHIRITATVDQSLTNVCSWTRNQSNQVVAVTASTECNAVVECLPPPKTGCTPGFWKNCTIHWQPAGFSPNQSVSSVFSLGACCTSLGSLSLIAALDLGGGSGTCGGAQNLLRAAVAGLLNASSPEVDYPMTQQELIGLVNAALQSCNRSTMIALASEIDRNNNLGCRDANGNGLPCHRLSNIPRAAPSKPAEASRTAPTRE